MGMKKECIQFVIGVISLIAFLYMTLILMSMANDYIKPSMALVKLIVPSIVLSISLWIYCKLDAIR